LGQTLLHLGQRQIRLLFDPVLQILPHGGGEFAGSSAGTARRAVRASGGPLRRRDLFRPSQTDVKALGQLSQAAFSTLMRAQQLSA